MEPYESIPDPKENSNESKQPSSHDLSSSGKYLAASHSDIPTDEEIGGDETIQIYPSLLEERHKSLNNMFGIKPWKPTIRRRNVDERSPEVQRLYLNPRNTSSSAPVATDEISFSKVVWTLVFGWWIALVYLVLSALLIIFFQRSLAKKALELARFIFYPFGKFIVRQTRDPLADGEEAHLLPAKSSGQEIRTSTVFAYYLWVFLSVLTIVPAHLVAFVITWFSVFMIPMSKLNRELIPLMLSAPLALMVENEYPGAGAELEICVFQAANLYYYKYSVAGMNIILVNMMAFVLMTVLIGYVPPFNHVELHAVALFLISLCSIVPLSYYIGMALSSISAQTTLAVGAVLNATFGSIIELIIYYNSLRKGFGSMTMSAVIGGLLGNLLLLPGLSMICGGIKYRNQRFNRVSAGVSSVLLIIAFVGAFTPTIFYQSYGRSMVDCQHCKFVEFNSTHNVSYSGASFPALVSGHSSALDVPYNETFNYECAFCFTQQSAEMYDRDPIYTDKARPLVLCVAAILPLAYAMGLLFTLKTHTDIYTPPPGEHKEGGGHDAPEWNQWVCIAILLSCTLLLALVSEELVEAIQPTLDSFHVTESFMGISILAVVPSTAEYVNAIQFALQNNVALSIEIGFSGAIQIAMIQIPSLIVLSSILSSSTATSFTLMFPMFDVAAVFLSILIVNYVSIEGRANYFLGFALTITWVLLIVAFYFVPVLPLAPILVN